MARFWSWDDHPRNDLGQFVNKRTGKTSDIRSIKAILKSKRKGKRRGSILRRRKK